MPPVFLARPVCWQIPTTRGIQTQHRLEVLPVAGHLFLGGAAGINFLVVRFVSCLRTRPTVRIRKPFFIHPSSS